MKVYIILFSIELSHSHSEIGYRIKAEEGTFFFVSDFISKSIRFELGVLIFSSVLLANVIQIRNFVSTPLLLVI